MSLGLGVQGKVDIHVNAGEPQSVSSGLPSQLAQTDKIAVFQWVRYRVDPGKPSLRNSGTALRPTKRRV